MPSSKKRIATYLSDDEYDAVAEGARKAGVSLSQFIKRVCLGEQVPSKVDHKALLALLKANADLGRLGGLLKMGLSDGSAGRMAPEFRSLLRQIERSQARVAMDCREMVESLKEKK